MQRTLARTWMELASAGLEFVWKCQLDEAVGLAAVVAADVDLHHQEVTEEVMVTTEAVPVLQCVAAAVAVSLDHAPAVQFVAAVVVVVAVQGHAR